MPGRQSRPGIAVEKSEKFYLTLANAVLSSPRVAPGMLPPVPLL
jgi:hypothetical protein